jgi:GNAT superfamily N-acetyltransferase
MALKFIDHGTKEYQQMIDLRMQILRTPLGLTFSKADLENEKDDILLGCFDEEHLEACCILTGIEPADTVKLRQMAVLDGLQGKGIGRALMNFAEKVARDAGYNKLTMHARKTAVGFYEKLGYNICGDEFEEVTVPHYPMEKKLH